MIGLFVRPQRERNVVRFSAAVSGSGALRDETKSGCVADLFLHEAQVKLQWFLLGCIHTLPVPVTSNCDHNISSLLISHYIFPFCIVD